MGFIVAAQNIFFDKWQKERMGAEGWWSSAEEMRAVVMAGAQARARDPDGGASSHPQRSSSISNKTRLPRQPLQTSMDHR